MIFIYILLFIFICLTLFFAFRYYTLNNDIKNIIKRMEMINKYETNLIVDSTSMRKQIIKLVKLINKNIKYINEYRTKVNHEEIELRNTITNISHDLRTPITSILGYVHLLQTNGNLSEEDLKYVDIINNRLEVLKQLLENLFNYSLVYDNVDQLELHRENIILILEDSLTMYYNELINKGIEPIIEIKEEAIFKQVDKLALKRVFNNLISNVIKYGTGKFRVEINENEIIFQNKTNSYDQIDVGRIFDRFFTVTRARNNNSMGLGLSISKALIEKMNGTINATLEGDILTFYIKLKN